MLFTVMTMKNISTKKKPAFNLKKFSNKIHKLLNKKVETNLYHHKDYQKYYQNSLDNFKIQ